MKKVLSLSLGVFLFFTSHVVLAVSENYTPAENAGYTNTGSMPCSVQSTYALHFTYNKPDFTETSEAGAGINVFNITIGGGSGRKCVEIDQDCNLVRSRDISFCFNLKNNFQLSSATGVSINNNIITLTNYGVATNIAGKVPYVHTTSWQKFKPN